MLLELSQSDSYSRDFGSDQESGEKDGIDSFWLPEHLKHLYSLFFSKSISPASCHLCEFTTSLTIHFFYAKVSQNWFLLRLAIKEPALSY